MLVYSGKGIRDFGEDPATPKTRSAWEFWALLSGSVAFDIESDRNESANEAVLLVFPPDLHFGCHGWGESRRAVFDFNTVPRELEASLPRRGYYRIALNTMDCERIEQLSELAQLSIEQPTQFASLQQRAIVAELSLVALREVHAHPLRGQQKAQAKVDQALAWYATNMEEKPTLEDVSRSVNVSASHLRRMFHKVCAKSPKAQFCEIRMERAQALLSQSDMSLEDIASRIGFSDATALSRAVKKHFGMSPGHLRKFRARQREKGF